MVLAAAGGVEHERLVELGEKYFGDLSDADEAYKLESGKFIASHVSFHQNLFQTNMWCLRCAAFNQ